MKASGSLARMERRAPASNTSRAASRREGGVLGWGVRACSFRRVILARLRRVEESA